ncbi:MAG: hypothetical protein SVU88_04855 [Candidatus Nanohaloarchaea archaeon]|nr:hypothetical protein [Candidatus Nanohaloarchaea archaeon]
MLTAEEQMDLIVRDTDRVGELARERQRPENRSGEVVVAVHLGNYALHAAHQPGDTTDHLDADYAEYCRDAYGEVRRAVKDADAAVAALYPNSFETEHRRVMGAYREDMTWIPTWNKGAVPTDEGIERWADVYNTVADGGQLTIAGEEEGRCYDYTLLFADAMRQRLDKDFGIVRGPSYGRDG